MSQAPLDTTSLEKVVAPFGENRTLTADAYTSREVFDWEMENLFRTTWMCVGRGDELVGPGQIRAIEVAGEGVLLARDRDGALTAFSNVCRHRGHELAPVGEAIDARLIRCPYHSWSYRFNGDLRAAPTFTQTPNFDMSEFPLIGIAATEYMGWIWVDLSGEAKPIEDHFGNLAEKAEPYETERLSTGAVHSYVVDANWKIVVENYNECYHCSSIHPELCEVTPTDSGYDHVPTGIWCGGTMTLKDHAVTMSLDGASNGVNFRNVDAELARHVWYITVIPNLRGGGEFGEAWHRAGMLESKQNVFDDAIAVAEHLVREGYAAPERLEGMQGGDGGASRAHRGQHAAFEHAAGVEDDLAPEGKRRACQLLAHQRDRIIRHGDQDQIRCREGLVLIGSGAQPHFAGRAPGGGQRAR